MPDIGRLGFHQNAAADAARTLTHLRDEFA
jgi:hypothetical protein